MEKILVIDDDKAFRNVLQHKLEHEGFSVTSAETVDEANNLIAENTYDLISVDLIIGTKSGFDILTANPGLETPIVISSSLSQDTDKEKALALGASAYFSKLDMSLSQVVQEMKAILS
jgi:DNA-binding response OmpR family regulator